MKRKDPPKQQRNAPCQCGSGKKYKKCHLLIEREEAEQAEIVFRERLKQRSLEAEKRREEFVFNVAESGRTPFGRHPSALTAAVLMGAMLGGMCDFGRNR